MIGEIRLLGDFYLELPEDFAIPESFLRFPKISKDFRHSTLPIQRASDSQKQ
jgi:hypothetical protein